MQALYETVEKTETERKLELSCECCGEKIKRWDMDMVQPAEDSLLPSDDFNFACPVCVTERGLIPLQTSEAKKFRMRNQTLREVLDETPVH